MPAKKGMQLELRQFIALQRQRALARAADGHAPAALLAAAPPPIIPPAAGPPAAGGRYFCVYILLCGVASHVLAKLQFRQTAV